MSFSVPTLATLIQRVKSDFVSETGVDAFIRARPEYAFSRVLAALAKGTYSYLKYLHDQAFYDTASDASFWKHLAQFGLSRTAAVAWAGTTTFTGTPSTSIPAATTIQRSDGAQYTTDAIASIGAGGSVDVAITASVAGATGSCDVGTFLTLVSPISGVTSITTVSSTTAAGADIESRASAETRLDAHLANPVQAGGPGTYKAAALAVAGVTRAWEFPRLDGYGTVSVAFARDDDASPVPDAGEVATVQTALEAVAPVATTVSAITVTGSALSVTISALTPDTAATRTAIETSLEDLVLRKGPSTTITQQEIRDAVSNAGGEITHTLDSPAADVSYATNELPTWGTLTVN